MESDSSGLPSLIPSPTLALQMFSKPPFLAAQPWITRFSISVSLISKQNFSFYSNTTVSHISTLQINSIRTKQIIMTRDYVIIRYLINCAAATTANISVNELESSDHEFSILITKLVAKQRGKSSVLYFLSTAPYLCHEQKYRLPYLDVAGLFHQPPGVLLSSVPLGQLNPEEF